MPNALKSPKRGELKLIIDKLLKYLNIKYTAETNRIFAITMNEM